MIIPQFLQAPPAPATALALHGVFGDWDELILLAAGLIPAPITRSARLVR